MDIDLEKMLAKVKASQWALADIDWDAPGAELITDEQWPKLKAFMSDLMWIEHVGARGFAAMARKAEDPVLKEMYTYFHAEEQRHANAEMALMRRWGMLEEDEIPLPNINLRLVIDWLDTQSDKMPLEVLGSVIPMLEVALDGALCTFLLEQVADPVCHDAFKRINDDESRHLGARARHRQRAKRPCWMSRSLAPVFPASVRRSVFASRALAISPSSNAATMSAAPGGTTPIPALPAIFPPTCIRSRSPRTRTGRAAIPGAPRYSTISTTWSTVSSCVP